ncbi:polyadenylate-binding protein-interacting protein 9-like isoform X2 [Bidens hawaiensis]|uniref:polyadenylate-binding protein-interacting protein 9-like isoform X2 n=1 Tax=Bidens hawaiensis TaxID=980011 RepID=UPI0040490421
MAEITSESSAAAATADDDDEVNLQDMFSNINLNPTADDSSISLYNPFDFFAPILLNVYHADANDGHPNNNNNNRRRRSKYTSRGRKQMYERASKAQSQDRIKRTVYVSDIDHNITKDRLVALFSTYGQVLECRVCGDPHSRLRFAFVEFADENSARSALNLSGIMLGFSQVTVLRSKTAILPSEDEKEMCARTVYCTNIDKKLSQDEVKYFFEARCGEVSHIRLLGDPVQSRIAFVEFMTAESAVIALDCSGQTLGTRPIRVSPSKTPVKDRVARSPSTN